MQLDEIQQAILIISKQKQFLQKETTPERYDKVMSELISVIKVNNLSCGETRDFFALASDLMYLEHGTISDLSRCLTVLESRSRGRIQ